MLTPPFFSVEWSISSIFETRACVAASRVVGNFSSELTASRIQASVNGLLFLSPALLRFDVIVFSRAFAWDRLFFHLPVPTNESTQVAELDTEILGALSLKCW